MKKLLTIGVLCAALFGAYIMTSCETEPPLAIEYAVDVTIGQGGSVATEVEGETASKAFEGESVTLTATPDEDYEFDKWTVESGGVELSDNPATFSMPAADVSVKAEFREKDKTPYAINVVAGENGRAEATVDGEPVTEAPQGTKVTLTATPHVDHLFVKWTTESEGVEFDDEESETTTFIMPAAEVEIGAEFIFDEEVLIMRPIVLTDDGNGTAIATVDGKEVTEASRGTEVTITAIPNEGYAFEKWTPVGDDVDLYNENVYKTTFKMPAAEVEVGVVFIDESEVNVLTRIPDPFFNKWCKIVMDKDYDYYHHFEGPQKHSKWDTNGDGRLSVAEAEAVKIINIGALEDKDFDKEYNGVATLAGIEYFKNLETLECMNGYLTELDLSNNTALTYVDVHSNFLKKLDVSKCTELYYELECQKNQLTSLDVSNCTKLKYLDCQFNQLTSLDVSNCTAMYTLLCCNNRMTELDITNMVFYDTGGNLIDDAYGVWAGIQTSDGTTPQLLTLTLREDQKRYWYEVAHLVADDFLTGPNMYVVVKGDPANILDFIDNPGVKAYIEGWFERRPYDGMLSVAEALHVTQINVPSQNLKSTEWLKYFPNLTHLGVNDNDLTSLDVSKHTKLTYLYCDDNKLTSLNISGCTDLHFVVAHYNRLTELDASDMANPDDYFLLCGLQTSDGTTPQGVALALRDEQIPYWESHMGGYTHNGIHWNSDVRVNTANILDKITDSRFRTYCQQFDTDNDGILTQTEAQAVTTIAVANMDITSLAGIEYFTEITILSCSGNKLTTLDVSKNTKLTQLICAGNQLTSLNISGCKSLTQLIAAYNRMTALDASDMANPSGYTLLCGHQTSDGTTNHMLTLNLREEQKQHWNNSMKNVADNLYVILTGELNIFDKLDPQFLIYCERMSFDRDRNGILTELEAREVTTINVDNYNIASLSGIEYFSEITQLRCSSNFLTSLDVSKNTKLNSLQCQSNKLTSINISGLTELVYINCQDNKLTSLNVSGLTNLTTIDCENNQLTSLDVSGFTKLMQLTCSNNILASLKVSGCTKLNYLHAYANRLTTLDASDISGDATTYELLCGQQTTNGTTPRTLTLTLREELKSYWNNILKNHQLNSNVVLAD